MRLKVTKQFLREHRACQDGFRYWCEQKKPHLFDFIRHCIKDKDNQETDESPLNYANWLIVRCMTPDQYLRYAIYAAKQSFPEYEKFAPDDKRVKDAIKAAENVLKNNTAANRSAAATAARSAARSAWSAESAARSAWSGATSARSAAWSAVWSAESAEATSARSAESAARSAARSAATAAWQAAESARSAMLIKILRYGMRIMKLSKQQTK